MEFVLINHSFYRVATPWRHRLGLLSRRWPLAGAGNASPQCRDITTRWQRRRESEAEISRCSLPKEKLLYSRLARLQGPRALLKSRLCGRVAGSVPGQVLPRVLSERPQSALYRCRRVFSSSAPSTCSASCCGGCGRPHCRCGPGDFPLRSVSFLRAF